MMESYTSFEEIVLVNPLKQERAILHLHHFFPFIIYFKKWREQVLLHSEERLFSCCQWGPVMDWSRSFGEEVMEMMDDGFPALLSHFPEGDGGDDDSSIYLEEMVEMVALPFLQGDVGDAGVSPSFA